MCESKKESTQTWNTSSSLGLSRSQIRWRKQEQMITNLFLPLWFTNWCVTATSTLTQRLHNHKDTHSRPLSSKDDAPVRAGLTSWKGDRVAWTVANPPAGREPKGLGAGRWPRALALEGPLSAASPEAPRGPSNEMSFHTPRSFAGDQRGPERTPL